MARRWRHRAGDAVAPHAASMVIAWSSPATNVSERAIADDTGYASIGDATAARTAAMAIYEGRKWAMEV